METRSGIVEKRDEIGLLGTMVSAVAPKRRKGGTPPSVFWEKRLQAIENKERRSEKERQEISRGGKFLKD
jgi:hypothetical protein